MSSDSQDSSGLGRDDKQAYVHTLSLRLTHNQYRRLRRFVTTAEERTSHRLTHQAVLELALKEFLDRNIEDAA